MSRLTLAGLVAGAMATLAPGAVAQPAEANKTPAAPADPKGSAGAEAGAKPTADPAAPKPSGAASKGPDEPAAEAQRQPSDAPSTWGNPERATPDATATPSAPAVPRAPSAPVPPASSEATVISSEERAPPGTPITPTYVRPKAEEDEPVRPTGPVVQHVDIAVDVVTVFYKDESYDVFTDEDTGSFIGLSAGYSIWLGDAFSLVPRIGWGVDSQFDSGGLGGALQDIELSSDQFLAGLEARYEIAGFLEPHLRAMGGIEWTRIDVNMDLDFPTFETDTVAPVVELGGGITLKTRDRMFQVKSGFMKRLVAGFTLEGGYRAAGSIDISLDETDPDQRIPITSPSLGTLKRSGPFVRGAATLRF